MLMSWKWEAAEYGMEKNNSKHLFVNPWNEMMQHAKKGYVCAC